MPRAAAAIASAVCLAPDDPAGAARKAPAGLEAVRTPMTSGGPFRLRAWAGVRNSRSASSTMSAADPRTSTSSATAEYAAANATPTRGYPSHACTVFDGPPFGTIESRGSFRPHTLCNLSQRCEPSAFLRTRTSFSFLRCTLQEAHGRGGGSHGGHPRGTTSTSCSVQLLAGR